MADVNLPSFSDLGQMEFMAPMAFQQAQNQIGLANQFQQQNLATGEQDLQAKTLANQFSQQANPMRLQGLGLENEGKKNANTLSGIDARTAMALEPEAKAARRQALLTKASEDELKQLMSTAEKEYMSDDPVVSKRAENKLLHTKAELTRRNAAADALERAQASAEARLQGIQLAQDAQTGRTQMTNASRESLAARKEAALQAKAQGNPKTAEAAAIKFQMEADMEDDPAEKARLAQLAKQYGAYSMALKNAQAGTKPDMAQFGFTTNPVNMGVGGVNPAPTRQAGGGSGLAGGGANDQQNILLQEYKNATDPRDREAVARELQRAGYRGALPGQQPSGQPTQAPAGPANVPKAPAGRVVIYKDGKAIGSVPESQVEAAKQQGYSVK
jgi:hypothetical protein